MAAGPGRLTDEGQREPMDVSDGDKVLYAKYAGTEFKSDDDEFLLKPLLEDKGKELAEKCEAVGPTLEVFNASGSTVIDPHYLPAGDRTDSRVIRNGSVCRGLRRPFRAGSCQA